MPKFLLRQRRGLAALTVIALVLGVLAVVHKGVPAARLELNDGGVWVTNLAKRLVAHLNYPSHTLDGGLRAASGDFDVSQSANTVLLHDDGSGKVQSVDTASISVGDGAPTGSEVSITQGGEVAVASSAKLGKLWVFKAVDVAGFTPEGDATMDKLIGVRTIVGTDGVVHAITPDGGVRRIADGKASDDGRIEGLKDLSTAELTTVGSVLVVLDKASSTIRTNKGSVPVTAAEKLVLQQPGPESDKVLAAGPDTYLWAPLSGGNPTVVPNGATSAGTPTSPVMLEGCGYLAWSGSGAYVRDCTDNAFDKAEVNSKLASFGQIAFRVNRKVVVLNDLANGDVLLVNEKMRVVNNWVEIENAAKTKENPNVTTEETTEQLQATQKTKNNTKPEAKDDEFGVRPGRSFTLPVLENDADADGDLLTATPKTQPSGAKVAPVRGGEALSIDVPAAASGSYTFTYTADDGRQGQADASVKVTVFPSNVNEAPAQKRASQVRVAARGEAGYSILGDFRDPEGDALYVTAVEQPSGLSVRFRPDGVITVRDLGTGGTAPRDVPVTVSDGTKSFVGKLKVSITDQSPPEANTDHVTVLKGQDAVVRPLTNDVDPMGGQLRLSTVADAGVGQTIKPDYAAGTFTFSSTTAGSFYVAYQVANDSPTPSLGFVRVDVAEPAAGAPVASDDLAMLPVGGSVLVDPLANDTDPSGGVLVLKAVNVPPDKGMAVEILDHHQVRIAAPAGLSAPTDVTYTVANAAGEATGRITVIPLPPTGSAAPPSAFNDKAVVRLGDIVTVAVLDNDLSPSGLALTIDPKVEIEGDAAGAAGDAFVSRDVVRFRAKKAGQFRVNYTVRDTALNYATGQIVITVNPLEMPNTPPVPQPITARMLAGSTITIPVPVNGVDPEGDSVSFVGLASGAGKGTAVAKGDVIEYTAPAGQVGTDTFRYEVADRFGVKAQSSVSVGIVPPNAQNQSPVAVPDDVATRPDRALSVNPIGNDTDPDGDQLSLVPGSVTPTDSKTTAPASVVAGRIELKTPSTEGTLRYYYGVTDGQGGTAKGVVTVRVSKDAVLKPPIARDDVVTDAQIKDAKTVEVDVLANDGDPDGSVKDLVVSSADAGVTASGGKLVIPVTDQRQVVLYTVTDIDKNTAKAAVLVPAASAALPYIDQTKVPLKVKAGELLTIPLAGLVVVRQGRTPMLTFAAKVKAGNGADTGELVKDATTLQFRSTKEFSGLSSVTFEVTDGKAPDDPEGRLATLTVPIEVEAAVVLHPPVFRASDVTAGAGDPATEVDLKSMVTDPDPGDMDKLEFSLGATPTGVKVTLNGSRLSVSAPPDAALGVAGKVEVRVTDKSTPAVSGQVTVKVTASSRPLMTIQTAVVNDANAGVARTVDLSNLISNPFADEGLPVTIVGQPTVTGATGAGVTVSGLAVTITPPADFHGQLVVTYTAQDGTKKAERNVNGTIELTVRARPDKPTGVMAESHLSKTATVTWVAGANNGAQIDRFTVFWSGGSKDCGQVTTCLIDTLANAQSYIFTVKATNVVGDSDASDPSGSVTVDVRPNPPGVPTGTFGDRQIALTWAAATVPDGGSPVVSYSVQISPAAGGTTQRDGVTGTSLTWTGLTNGTAYTFRVQAKNGNPTNPLSDWSGWSAPVVPAGVPFTPAAPSAQKDPVSTLAPSATITWTPPNGNGDSNMTYEMRRTGTTTVLYSGTNTSAHVTMPVETTDQTYEVRAKNKAGWSAWSPASNGIRGFQTPGAVTSLSVSATGADNTVAISFGAAAGNGATPSEITYYWTANGTTQSIAAGGGTVTSGAFPNGTNVGVAVYAVSKVNGESAQGPSTSATVNAYGPPVSPSISCSGGDQAVNCSWSGGNDNGRPTSYVLSGDTSGNVGPSGSTTLGGIGYSASRTVCIQAQQNTGLTGSRNCASATSNPQPSYIRVRSISGLKITIETSNFPNPGTGEMRGWNAATIGDHKWNQWPCGTSGNYLGYATNVTIPQTGVTTFTLSGNPCDSTMRPDANFSIELYNVFFAHVGLP